MSTNPSTPTPDDQNIQIQKDLDALNISKPEHLEESNEDSDRAKQLKAELRNAREELKSKPDQHRTRIFNKIAGKYINTAIHGIDDEENKKVLLINIAKKLQILSKLEFSGFSILEQGDASKLTLKEVFDDFKDLLAVQYENIDIELPDKEDMDTSPLPPVPPYSNNRGGIPLEQVSEPEKQQSAPDLVENPSRQTLDKVLAFVNQWNPEAKLSIDEANSKNTPAEQVYFINSATLTPEQKEAVMTELSSLLGSRQVSFDALSEKINLNIQVKSTELDKDVLDLVEKSKEKEKLKKVLEEIQAINNLNGLENIRIFKKRLNDGSFCLEIYAPNESTSKYIRQELSALNISINGTDITGDFITIPLKISPEFSARKPQTQTAPFRQEPPKPPMPPTPPNGELPNYPYNNNGVPIVPPNNPYNNNGVPIVPPNYPYNNNGVPIVPPNNAVNNGAVNPPPNNPAGDIFGEDKYHEKLEDGKTSESEIAKERTTRLERTRSALQAKLNPLSATLNTPNGLRNATEQAFDVVMQASNQVMLDRQAYRIGKQGKLRRGFNSLREGLASKYPKTSFFLSAAVRTGAILGAAALAPQLGAITAFGFTTAALRRPAAAMIAKFRTSQPSGTSAYSNLAIMQQMELRKTTASQVSSTTVKPNMPVGTLDNSLYEGYKDIAEKNQAKLKDNVKNKLRASTLFTSPTSTPAQKTQEIIRVMMEEQEAMFKQMETERDKLMRVRVTEWLGAAAMAGILAFGMHELKAAFGGGDTPPVKTDPVPVPPDPVPTPPPIDPVPVPPVITDTPIGSFTGDFSTAERVFDPSRSLLDVSNPGNMTNPLPGVELSNSMAVEVSTEAKGAAGRLLIHDPNNIGNVVGRFNPGEHIKVDGASVLADIKNPVTGELTKMRMFPVVGEDGVRKGLVAGAYLKRL